MDESGEDAGFLDAERIFTVLERVPNAPNLYESATDKFPGAPEDLPRLDEKAFEYLVNNEFLDVPHELRNKVDRFRHLDHAGERTRAELNEVYRDLKIATLHLRKLNKASEGMGAMLTSKSRRWELDNQRTEQQHKVDELMLRRRRAESDLEKCGTLLKELLDEIYGDLRLRESHWFYDMPTVVTGHGRFLLEYLQDMNPAHFRGRTLAEIIEIGHSLA